MKVEDKKTVICICGAGKSKARYYQELLINSGIDNIVVEEDPLTNNISIPTVTEEEFTSIQKVLLGEMVDSKFKDFEKALCSIDEAVLAVEKEERVSRPKKRSRMSRMERVAKYGR